MKKYFFISAFAILLSLFFSCSENESSLFADELDAREELKDSTVYYFIVASQQMNTNFEVIPYIIKKSNSSDWEYLWDPIYDFNYEAGYEYEIEAKFNYYDDKDLQDVGSGYYQLIKVISKEKKESIGIIDLVNPSF